MPLDEVCSIISPHRLQYTRDDKRLACQALWMPPWQLLHTHEHCMEAVDFMYGLAMNISKAVGLYFRQPLLMCIRSLKEAKASSWQSHGSQSFSSKESLSEKAVWLHTFWSLQIYTLEPSLGGSVSAPACPKPSVAIRSTSISGSFFAASSTAAIAAFMSAGTSSLGAFFFLEAGVGCKTGRDAITEDSCYLQATQLQTLEPS